MASTPVALQMYTVRDHAARDFLGTLKYVSEIGYDGVEFAGFGNMEAEELRKALDDLGLQAVSAHIGLAELEGKLNQVVDYNLTVGNSWITIPSLPPELRKNAEDWQELGVRLNALGLRCRRQGIQLCYHNHAFEFEKHDGRYGLDILYGASGADLLQTQIDIYWVKRAGVDPAEYLRKYKGRSPLLHLKDMEAGPEQFFAEVGEGIIDLESVAAAAQEAGVKWYIVEQDRSRRDSKESARISISNLKARGLTK